MIGWLRYRVSVPFVATVRAVCWVTGWSSYRVGRWSILGYTAAAHVRLWPWSVVDVLVAMLALVIGLAVAFDLDRMDKLAPADVLPTPGYWLAQLLWLRALWLVLLALGLVTANWSLVSREFLVLLTLYAYEVGQPGGPSCVRRAVDAVRRLTMPSIGLRPALPS